MTIAEALIRSISVMIPCSSPRQSLMILPFGSSRVEPCELSGSGTLASTHELRLERHEKCSVPVCGLAISTQTPLQSRTKVPSMPAVSRSSPNWVSSSFRSMPLVFSSQNSLKSSNCVIGHYDRIGFAHDLVASHSSTAERHSSRFQYREYFFECSSQIIPEEDRAAAHYRSNMSFG